MQNIQGNPYMSNKNIKNRQYDEQQFQSYNQNYEPYPQQNSYASQGRFCGGCPYACHRGGNHSMW